MATGEQLEATKRASTLQLRAARPLNEQAIARVRERTGQPVRTAHTRLFPHIDLTGTRPTELARRLGVCMQAVGQLVDELEAMGVFERVPDPADGRARLVRFAGGGEVLLDDLGGQLEAERAAEIGPERMAGLRDALLALDPLLG